MTTSLLNPEIIKFYTCNGMGEIMTVQTGIWIQGWFSSSKITQSSSPAGVNLSVPGVGNGPKYSGMGEIMMVQTGIPTRAPWISGQVLYQLSYLEPVFEQVWPSHTFFPSKGKSTIKYTGQCIILHKQKMHIEQGIDGTTKFNTCTTMTTEMLYFKSAMRFRCAEHAGRVMIYSSIRC